MKLSKLALLVGMLSAFIGLAVVVGVKKVQALQSDSIHTIAVYQEDGDSVGMVSVKPSTSAPVLLMSGSQFNNVRWIDLCNSSTYYWVAVGTYTAFSTTSGLHIDVPANWCEPMNENTTFYIMASTYTGSGTGGLITNVGLQVRYSSQ